MWGDLSTVSDSYTEAFRDLHSDSETRELRIRWGHVFARESLYRDPYAELFPALQTFDETKDIHCLIKKEDEQNSYWNRMFNPSKEKHKLFKNLFRQWRDDLDAALERARYDENSRPLKRLKKIAAPILEENLVLVRLRLIDHQLFLGKTEEAFNQFENLLKRVLQTPTLKQIREGRLKQKSALPIIPNLSMAAFASPVFRSLAPFAITQAGLRNRRLIESQTLPKKLKKSKSEGDLSKHNSFKENKPAPIYFPPLEKPHVRIFSFLLPTFGSNWEEHLGAAFKRLSSLKEIAAAAKIYEQTQVLSLISNFLRDETVSEKLAVSLCSLRGEVFLAVIKASEERITELNSLLKHFQERKPKLAESKFRKLSLELIDSSNYLRNKIDAYAEKFRALSGNNLSSLDLNEIYSLKQHVRLKIETLHLFKTLFKGVLKKQTAKGTLTGQAETKHILLVDLLHEHELFLRRLTEKSTDEDIGGSIFSIIIRNVFENSLFDEVLEFIGEWSICRIEDYHDIGLYGEIQKEALHFEKIEYHVKLRQLAASNLKAIELDKTTDLARKDIYNKAMFKSYLQQKSIKSKLRELTEKNLALIFQRED